MVSRINLFFFLIMCIIPSGCIIADSSHVIVGSTREPIDFNQVKLYTKAPMKYEEIAILSSKAAHDFMSDQPLIDEAIKRLKQEAAALGANGILLERVGESGEQSSGVAIVPTGSNVGFFMSESGSGKSAKGLAIFVLEE